MSKEYYKSVKETAIELLKLKGEPQSEKVFIVGIIASLKKKLGKLDKRHTSKGRFRTETFRNIIKTNEWKNDIAQINNGKYSLTIWLKELPEKEVDSDYDWKTIGIEEAKFKTLNLLKKLDPFKFEELVGRLIEKLHPGFTAEVTKKSGDMGIDVKAYKNSEIQEGKRLALFAQAKCFKGTVGRDQADKFIGAVKEFHNKENWEAFYALFVTTGKFAPDFRTKMKNSEEKGVNFISLDGNDLVEKLFQFGWGMTFSINTQFWDDLDSKLIPKEIVKEKDKLVNKERKVKTKNSKLKT